MAVGLCGWQLSYVHCFVLECRGLGSYHTTRLERLSLIFDLSDPWSSFFVFLLSCFFFFLFTCRRPGRETGESLLTFHDGHSHVMLTDENLFNNGIVPRCG